MAPSLIHDPIRKLALWQDGYTRGVDTGLVIAMTAITCEIARQDEDAAQQRGGPHSLTTGRHEYAAAVLLDVATVLARRFWQ
jgi:hypothetical protein